MSTFATRLTILCFPCFPWTFHFVGLILLEGIDFFLCPNFIPTNPVGERAATHLGVAWLEKDAVAGWGRSPLALENPDFNDGGAEALRQLGGTEMRKWGCTLNILWKNQPTNSVHWGNLDVAQGPGSGDNKNKYSTAVFKRTPGGPASCLEKGERKVWLPPPGCPGLGIMRDAGWKEAKSSWVGILQAKIRDETPKTSTNNVNFPIFPSAFQKKNKKNQCTELYFTDPPGCADLEKLNL